ncbi:MmgE/PrpD family protein [bacterium RCC_150]
MHAPVRDQLGDFVAKADYESLPEGVLHESKRLVLDSIGCALAAGDHTKGRIGVEFADILGGGDSSATVIGSTKRSSVFGAAFANGELINALDFDAILPPGHVSPYVLPGLLAIAEVDRASGRDVLLAVAIAHELSNRFGKAMDSIRHTEGDSVAMPPILGYTSTVFGATAGIVRLRRANADVTAQALSIAASTTPVNSHRSWLEHTPVSTIKYTMAGPISQVALTAAFMAFLGHRGDPGVFDDPEFGYPRFIGSSRWEPENLTSGLGVNWNFHRENSFKHYPHCRALHGLLDLEAEILKSNKIKPTEIQAIRAWGEGHVERASWLTNEISHPVDGQFSIAHGLAVGAQGIQPSKAWQSEEVVYDDDVLGLMDKVTYTRHPEWISLMSTDPHARPSRLEIDAHGRTYSAELMYPKGTPTQVGGMGTSDAELIAKFRLNAQGILPPETADKIVDCIMNLESIDDASKVLRLLGSPLPSA